MAQDCTNWCAIAALLQKASTTSTLVRFPSLISFARAVASKFSVISNSFDVKRPQDLGTPRTLVLSEFLLESKYSLGIRDNCSCCFLRAIDCQVEAILDNILCQRCKDC